MKLLRHRCGRTTRSPNNRSKGSNTCITWFVVLMNIYRSSKNLKEPHAADKFRDEILHLLVRIYTVLLENVITKIKPIVMVKPLVPNLGFSKYCLFFR